MTGEADFLRLLVSRLAASTSEAESEALRWLAAKRRVPLVHEPTRAHWLHERYPWMGRDDEVGYSEQPLSRLPGSLWDATAHVWGQAVTRTPSWDVPWPWCMKPQFCFGRGAAGVLEHFVRLWAAAPPEARLRAWGWEAPLPPP